MKKIIFIIMIGFLLPAYSMQKKDLPPLDFSKLRKSPCDDSFERNFHEKECVCCACLSYSCAMFEVINAQLKAFKDNTPTSAQQSYLVQLVEEYQDLEPEIAKIKKLQRANKIEQRQDTPRPHYKVNQEKQKKEDK